MNVEITLGFFLSNLYCCTIVWVYSDFLNSLFCSFWLLHNGERVFYKILAQTSWDLCPPNLEKAPTPLIIITFKCFYGQQDSYSGLESHCKSTQKPRNSQNVFVSFTSSSDGLAQYCLNLLQLFLHETTAFFREQSTGPSQKWHSKWTMDSRASLGCFARLVLSCEKFSLPLNDHLAVKHNYYWMRKYSHISRPSLCCKLNNHDCVTEVHYESLLSVIAYCALCAGWMLSQLWLGEYCL